MDSPKGTGTGPTDSGTFKPDVKPGQPLASTAEGSEAGEKSIVWEGRSLEKPVAEDEPRSKLISPSESKTLPEDTAAASRLVAAFPDFEMFPRESDELVAFMIKQAISPDSPFVRLSDETLAHYRAKAKKQSLASTGDFATALGKVCSIGHLLLELPALEGSERTTGVS